MKYGKPILALLSFWILICAKHKPSKEIADCYMFIVIDVRCFRISTSGFTSYDTWCSALFSFQRTPAIPSGAVRLSWISFYILPHPFRLVKNFLNLFSQALKTSGIRLSAAPALVAVCRRLVIYYTLPALLSILVLRFVEKNTKKFPIHSWTGNPFLFFFFYHPALTK